MNLYSNNFFRAETKFFSINGECAQVSLPKNSITGKDLFFIISPSVPLHEIMRKLLIVKKCNENIAAQYIDYIIKAAKTSLPYCQSN